jgi:hypothetical protein
MRRALYAATSGNSKKVIKEQVSKYEDETLSHELVPDECFALIIEILSTKELFFKPGIEAFLSNTYMDMERLTSVQKGELLGAASKHYNEYNRVEFCWVLCDLVARCYKQDVALQFFRGAFGGATYQGKEGVALGLDILARASGREPKLMKEIESILAAD